MCIGCTNSVTDNDADTNKVKTTVYAYQTDSALVIFKHGTTTPIVIEKPITLDALRKYNIPTSIVESKSQGMCRYVDGDENGVYEISIWVIILIVIVLYLIFG